MRREPPGPLPSRAELVGVTGNPWKKEKKRKRKKTDSCLSIGRKPVVSAALLGLGLQILWIMMVLYWHTVFPIWTIYIAAGFVFIGGGSALLLGIVLSIVSDVVEEDKR